MGELFRWLPYEGHRHAVSNELVAGSEGETLCGLFVVVPHSLRKFPEGCWPECPSCDSSWRIRKGIPLRCERSTDFVSVRS